MGLLSFFNINFLRKIKSIKQLRIITKKKMQESYFKIK